MTTQYCTPAQLTWVIITFIALPLLRERDILLTQNVKDFTPCDEYDLYTPDEFFVLFDDSASARTHAAVRDQYEYWVRRSPCGEIDLPLKLRTNNCPNFAERVLSHLKAIARES